MLKTAIVDPEGSFTAEVTPNRALRVSIVESNALELPVDLLTQRKQLREYMRSTAGSKDMNVDGSSTPVDFFAKATPGHVKWITGFRVILNGTYLELETADFRRFGAAATAPGLTNGLLLDSHQGGVVTDFFEEPIQNVGQFMDYSDNFTNLVNAISSQSDYLSFNFWLDTPLVLPDGSEDHLHLTVRDDLTALDSFQVAIRGYQQVQQ